MRWSLVQVRKTVAMAGVDVRDYVGARPEGANPRFQGKPGELRPLMVLSDSERLP